MVLIESLIGCSAMSADRLPTFRRRLLPTFFLDLIGPKEGGGHNLRNVVDTVTNGMKSSPISLESSMLLFILEWRSHPC